MLANFQIKLLLIALIINKIASKNDEKPSFEMMDEENSKESEPNENYSECSIFNVEQDYHYMMASMFAYLYYLRIYSGSCVFGA